MKRLIIVWGMAILTYIFNIVIVAITGASLVNNIMAWVCCIIIAVGVLFSEWSHSKFVLKRIIKRQIDTIYNIYPSGGALHIVLDDYNINNRDIKWCIDYINNSSDDIPEVDKTLLLACAINLLKLTKKERLEVIRESYISREE